MTSPPHTLPSLEHAHNTKKIRHVNKDIVKNALGPYGDGKPTDTQTQTGDPARPHGAHGHQHPSHSITHSTKDDPHYGRHATEEGRHHEEEEHAAHRHHPEGQRPHTSYQRPSRPLHQGPEEQKTQQQVYEESYHRTRQPEEQKKEPKKHPPEEPSPQLKLQQEIYTNIYDPSPSHILDAKSVKSQGRPQTTQSHNSHGTHDNRYIVQTDAVGGLLDGDSEESALVNLPVHHIPNGQSSEVRQSQKSHKQSSKNQSEKIPSSNYAYMNDVEKEYTRKSMQIEEDSRPQRASEHYSIHQPTHGFHPKGGSQHVVQIMSEKRPSFEAIEEEPPDVFEFFMHCLNLRVILFLFFAVIVVGIIVL
jgi:hypothetical protein